MRKLLLIISAAFLTTFCYANLNAQIVVNIKLDESEKVKFSRNLFCDKDYNCGLTENEKTKSDIFGKEKITITVRRADNDFYFTIGSDQKEILLKNGASVKVRIKRKTSTGEVLDLPYEISHEAQQIDGQSFDGFRINQHYKGTGTLSYKNCSYKTALTDMDYDGLFGNSDADGGTNFQIDFNNDSKIWGNEEYRKTTEIIEICGQNFVVSSLEKNVLKLDPTNLKIARLGERVPEFSFTLLNGKTITSESLKGKFYVFDFWASWCAPCVANLSQIASIENEYKNKLSVFSINVDKAVQKSFADKIVNEKKLFEYSSIRGLGDDDPFWKTFGSESVRLSIPLYVLVDDKGTLLYSGNGGNNLDELKSSITKVISK